MSDTPQGDGWWQASDHKWYPPESRPEARTEARPESGSETPSPASGLTEERAGFGIRLGAFLLNGLLVGIPLAIVFAVLVSSLPTEIEPCTVDGEFGLCEKFTSGSAAVLLFVTLGLWVLILVGYYGYFDGVTGATPGRRMTGLRLVDARTGDPIGMGRAVGRELFKIISGLVLFLGFLSVLWDPQKRAWHDMVVNSAVVRSG